MNTLTQTQEYFAKLGIKFLQEISLHDNLLHQQAFSFNIVFEIAPFLTGAFNNLTPHGKQYVIKSLLDKKIVRTVGENLYKFTSADITNQIVDALQQNPIVVKQKFIGQFSFAKYKIIEKTDDRYEYSNICFISSDDINIKIYLLKYSLNNGIVVQLYVLELPTYNQNDNNASSRACGSLGVVIAQPYLRHMDTVDPLILRIIVVLQSLPRVKCTEHSNCEHISNASQLLPLLTRLQVELADCINVEYIEKELKECKQFLEISGFEQWDESNALAQISSDMVQSLIEKYDTANNHETEQIALMNNPTQVFLSLQEGLVHEEYEIVQTTSQLLSQFSCTNPIIMQTCSDARTQEHFKTVNLYLPSSDECKAHEEPSICGAVLDFDTLNDSRKIGSIFTVSSLILNQPYLNHSILYYTEELFETEALLKKILPGYDEYNENMAWNLREMVKKSGSHWPRQNDGQLMLGYATEELRSWYIEDLDRLQITVEPQNINASNWQDFFINIDLDEVVKYKIFEIEQRSQWVALKLISKRLNEYKDEMEIKIESVRKQTLELKSIVLTNLRKIQRQLKMNVPESVRRTALQTIQILQKMLNESLYDEVAVNQ